MFFNYTADKERGIYLPLSQNEEKNTKHSSSTAGYFKRPYISILLLLSMMFTCMVMIGLYVFIDDNGGKFATSNQSRAVNDAPPLILISIDGFRYDYLKWGITPNLKQLARSGVHGPMRPQFPSYTFPNHYTLVTGLYPESHGIVGNSFFDPESGEYFSYTKQEVLFKSKWWLAEPIWNAVQRFGMRSATMFWPGSESFILGKRPNYFRAYDESVSTTLRVNQVLEWLDLPETKRPKFISMYMSLVDDAGHMFGPNSIETKLALKEVDNGIGYLVKELENRALHKKVNLLIVSDHGMVEIKDEDRFHIYLDDLIADMKKRLQWVDFGPISSIIPRKGQAEAIYNDLKEGEAAGMPFKVFYKEELPRHFHYHQSDRIAPIIVIADAGFIIDYRGGHWVPRGAHGYDPNISEMQALLIASGPDFRDKKHSAGRMDRRRPLKGISNLDIYPLMMHLLKITPLPNNGTMTLVDLIR